MSATNRGAKRAARDFYPTPQWLIDAFLWEYMLLRAGLLDSVLEPACGDGRILRAARKVWPDATTVGIDIAPGIIDDDVMTGDFLSMEPVVTFDLVVTNPPFSLAREFVDHAMKFTRPGGAVAMLFGLNFLGSQARGPWMRKLNPSVWVTPRRPDFTGEGGDANEYGWFVFDGRGELHWLETERAAA